MTKETSCGKTKEKPLEVIYGKSYRLEYESHTPQMRQYFRYHQEQIENALEDIDSLLATGKYAS